MIVYGRDLGEFNKRVQERSNSGAEAKIMAIRLSQSAFEGATSALTHFYTECGLSRRLQAGQQAHFSKRKEESRP